MVKRKEHNPATESTIVYTEVQSEAGQMVEAMWREQTHDLVERIVWDESFTKLALFYKGLPETSVFSYALPADWQNNLQVGKTLTFTTDNWYNELLAGSESLMEVR